MEIFIYCEVCGNKYFIIRKSLKHMETLHEGDFKAKRENLTYFNSEMSLNKHIESLHSSSDVS